MWSKDNRARRNLKPPVRQCLVVLQQQQKLFGLKDLCFLELPTAVWKQALEDAAKLGCHRFKREVVPAQCTWLSRFRRRLKPRARGSSRRRTRAASAGAADNVPFESVTSRFRELLAGLFPEGSWELEEAKILKTAQFLLLLKDYETLPDGRLKVAPCTVVFQPDGFQEGSEGGDYTWMLQAEAGAVVSFDGPVDPRKSGFGKLQGGYLPGAW